MNVRLAILTALVFAVATPAWCQLVDRRVDESISVKAYGATGDGTTDDSAAIQAAIHAVGAAGGGTVHFPPGRYNTGVTSVTLDADNVWLVGVGRGPSQVQYGGSGTAIQIGAPGGKAHSYCGLQGLLISKEGTARQAGSTGIAQYSGQSLCIRDCRILGFERGILLDGNGDNGRMGYITDCRIDNVRISGPTIGLDIQSPVTALMATGLHIVGPGQTQAGTCGIYFGPNCGQGNFVAETSIEAIDTGVSLGGGFSQIAGLRLEHCATGIAFTDATADGFKVYGCLALQCTTSFSAPPENTFSVSLEINGITYDISDGAHKTIFDSYTEGSTQKMAVWYVPGAGLMWRNPDKKMDIWHINTDGSVKADHQIEVGDDANRAPFRITARSAAPRTPQANEVYLDNGTNTASGFPGFRQYVGSAWRDIARPTTLTVIKTVGLQPAGTDDYHFDNTQANTAEQAIAMPNLLPAYAELTSFQIRCAEAINGGAAMTVKLGTTSGGTELMTGSAIHSINALGVPAAGSAPVLAATNAPRTIYFSATPGANWNTLSAGRWAILLTYIDYAAVYARRAP